ncbi:N-6 DNA methylase [Halobacillus mangrovi]|uniref:N-6 DNA methylase n=1 Tax=Halobacillus mangrovi TaxID=402384 RepID=UPI003D97235B
MTLELKIDESRNKIYAPLLGKELVLTPEEKVRQTYICMLVNEYGYDLKQMQQEMTVSNSKRGLGKARADIVIWKSEKDKLDKNRAFIVVECKAEEVKLQRGDFFQGANYASWMHAKFFVCVNLKEHRVFKTDEQKAPSEFLDEITEIPHARDINDEKVIQSILAKKKTFSKVDFQNLLLKCHNTFRDNDALAPDAAFDEISKILFMKINYERNRQMGEPDIFSLEVFKKKEKDYELYIKPTLTRQNPNFNLSYMDFWFEDTKNKYSKEKLFEENDKIKISRESFEKVIKDLQTYNLSETDDDVKGVAFEEFLSKTFRGAGLGQFFTPRTIVKFMTEIIDPQEGERICDPCCGSGGFLIYAFEYIRSYIEESIGKSKEEIKEQLLDELKNTKNLSEKEYEQLEIKVTDEIKDVYKQINQDLDNKKKGTRLNKLSTECIFGTDKEGRSARMAKMNMIMHGDGHGGVHQHEGLLNVNGIKDESFDVILTNPPFGSRVTDDLKDPTAPDKKIVDYFEVSKLSKLKEVMFTDRCLNLLKPGGRMGIVLPEGFLNNFKLQSVREYFEGRAKIVLIVSIPEDVFKNAGAHVKSSLIFLRKFTDEEDLEYKKIVEEAENEINSKYACREILSEKPLLRLKKKLKKTSDKEEKKEIRERIKFAKKEWKKRLAEIKELKNIEIKNIIKNRFDYEVPVAQVDKAGITSKGTATDNELDDIVADFKEYVRKSDASILNLKSIIYKYTYKDGKVYLKNNAMSEEV